jgi:hypothetical protein
LPQFFESTRSGGYFRALVASPVLFWADGFVPRRVYAFKSGTAPTIDNRCRGSPKRLSERYTMIFFIESFFNSLLGALIPLLVQIVLGFLTGTPA